MTEKFISMSGWGNYPRSCSKLYVAKDRFDVYPLSKNTLARGFGRSYGDAALNNQNYLLLTQNLNKILHFDSNTGILKAESGCSLEYLIDFLLPKGWFLCVTPGTQFVTLGGCIASDVHGKNHHCDGSFSNFVLSFTLSLSDGTFLLCSREENAFLFWATIGGMGLTGTIIDITIQLQRIPSAFMSVKYLPCSNLEETFAILNATEYDDKYSVAWLDTLSKNKSFGRSIVMNGHHAEKYELPAHMKDSYQIPKKKIGKIPCYFPSWILNSYTIKLFNQCYFLANKNKQLQIIDLKEYFYPLDVIHCWNRLYGKKGFFQYQCVVSFKEGKSVIQEILKILEKNNINSFLAILKKMGKANLAPLSFPMEGYTLSLDIPYKNKDIFSVLNELDHLVCSANGKIYLAKDARLHAKIFQKMYPGLEEWLKIKKEFDEKSYYQSDLSRRLEMFN